MFGFYGCNSTIVIGSSLVVHSLGGLIFFKDLLDFK